MVSIKFISACVSATSTHVSYNGKAGSQDEGYVSGAEFEQWIGELRSVVTHQEEWEAIGQKLTLDPHFSYLKDLAILAGGVEFGYWVALHWIMPIHLPMIKIESYQQNRDGTTQVELFFQTGVEPVLELFSVLKGFLKSIPKTYFDLENREIDLWLEKRNANFLIHTSADDHPALVESVKKTILNVPPLQSLTRQFAELQKQMLSYYSSGEEKEKRLKVMEHLLQASIKLSRLGETTASIVHQINNPLTITTLLLDSVSDHLSKKEYEKATLQLDKAKKTILKIGRTIQSVQDVLREDKKGEFSETLFLSLVDESLFLLEHRIQTTGTKIEIHFRPSLAIHCNEIQMTQVLSNLIGNSIDAIESFKHKWVKIAVDEEGPEFVIRVTDSGFGIPDAIRDKVFEPMFTTKSKENGTGFGLSVVKRIVESHQGKIEIDTGSENTCFVIRLPKAQ